MKKIFVVLVAFLILAPGVFATNARVESMGKHATFFMDDVSIFENPANINIYPNFLIGELGKMIEFSDSSTYYRNEDPAEPFGGGILSFSLNRDKSAETRYPMVCVGAIMNHENEMVDVLEQAALANGHIIPEPVVPNSDFFTGFTFANGIMIGGHLYAAVQNVEIPTDELADSLNVTSREELKNMGITTGIDTGAGSDADIFNRLQGTDKLIWESNVVRGDLGVNMPVTQNMDLEVSGGIALLQYSGPASAQLGALAVSDYSENDISFFVNARLFSTLLSLNGEIVPIFKLKKIAVRKYEVLEWELGVGANVTLDRGFFWAGAEFVRNVTTIPLGTSRTEKEESIIVPLSLGIERNIVWDWFVMRVGFRKVVFGSSTNQDDLEMMESNPEANRLPNDHAGFGVGLNIEEKLKIDGVVAEDIVYKWGNLISGNSHHILTRITATYSF
jgi:hypothetical protein